MSAFPLYCSALTTLTVTCGHLLWNCFYDPCVINQLQIDTADDTWRCEYEAVRLFLCTSHLLSRSELTARCEIFEAQRELRWSYAKEQTRKRKKKVWLTAMPPLSTEAPPMRSCFAVELFGSQEVPENRREDTHRGFSRGNRSTSYQICTSCGRHAGGPCVKIYLKLMPTICDTVTGSWATL